MGSRDSRGKRPPGSHPERELTEEEFFSMLDEMTDQISRGGDGSLDEDEEETITEEIPATRVSGDGAFEDTFPTEAVTVAAEHTADAAPGSEERRRAAVPEEATLRVRFSVQAAAGGGGFHDTEAHGELVGCRSYDVILLDELAFGFDTHRNSVEVVLDPGAATVDITDLEGSKVIALMLDADGQIKLIKAPGVRLDVYSIHRDGDDGPRQNLKLGEMSTDADGRFTLPTRLDEVFERFTEFMLGIGLTDEESLCYAFSVYVAVQLDRP